MEDEATSDRVSATVMNLEKIKRKEKKAARELKRGAISHDARCHIQPEFRVRSLQKERIAVYYGEQVGKRYSLRGRAE